MRADVRQRLLGLGYEMRVTRLPALFICLALSMLPSTGLPSIVYQNSFSTETSLDAFTLHGEEFEAYSVPALHDAYIERGQLRIDTESARPNGPGTFPVLRGSASLSIDSQTHFSTAYNSTLAHNSGAVRWSLNISNSDGLYNNFFACVLASTHSNPFDLSAQGYALVGGGLTDHRMYIKRFDSGLAGGGERVVDISQGLAVLPDKGSFSILFDPTDSSWSFYGATASSYTDPRYVPQLWGYGIDASYTQTQMPYLSLVGKNTGSTYFDNLSVQVIPEPAVHLTCIVASLSICFIRRRYICA